MSEARQSSRNRCSNHTDEPPTISMTGNGNSSDESNARGDRAPERSRRRTRRVVSDECNQKANDFMALCAVCGKVGMMAPDFTSRFRAVKSVPFGSLPDATLVANVIVDAHQGPRPRDRCQWRPEDTRQLHNLLRDPGHDWPALGIVSNFFDST